MPANLHSFINMSKEITEKLTGMSLVSYYAGLSRKERVMLQNYVASLFCLSASVVYARFTGRMEFTAAELIALKPVMEGELWRK